MRDAEYPLPAMMLAHLSDTHLRDPSDPLVRGTVDPRPNLVAALAGLAAAEPRVLLFTGDLSDDATPESYAELRRLVEPVARELRATVIWGNGNHDSRATFRAALLDEPASAPAAGPTGIPEPHPPLNQVHHVDGLRILWLDTTVPGADHGELAPESLDWLAAVLAEPAPAGTILGMHHAPLPVVQDLAASWELRGQGRLAEVLAGSDVRAILAGHFHQSGFGTFAGIGVHAATSLCYTQDLTTGRGIRGQDGAQGWHLVGVHRHTITTTVVPLGNYRSVTPPLTAAESTAELAARGVRIVE